MAIAISVSRQKLVTTVTKNFTLVSKPIVETGNKITLPIVIEDLVVDTHTVPNVATTSGQPTITAATGAFSKVRVGDAVTGTGIPASTTVSAVNGAASQVTLSANATATGTITITVDPGTFDSTVYILELENIVSGSVLTVKPTLYPMDGSKTSNKDNGYDAAGTSASLAPVNLASITINMDSYLDKARVVKTNS